MSDKINNLPVTTIVRLKPKPGLKKETLNWYQTISDKASHYSGLLSTEIFVAITDSTQPEFAIIFHFDTYENLMVWDNSPQKKEQLALSKALFDEVKPKIQLTGLEYWFEKKQVSTPITPPKWKMLILTILIIFTLLNTLMPFLTGILKPIGLSAILNMFLSITVMVTLMTYLVMPFITRILSGWLFKQKTGH